MPPGAPPLVGRHHELARLVAAVDGLAHGRGGVWLISGEAGIGKSRLLQAVAEVAEERDVALAWGRCWEAGGAPAYWPWVQVCRTLLDTPAGARAAAALGARAAHLLPVLPELRQRSEVPEPPQLEPEQARFALLDVAAGFLLEVASARPLLVMLEDLHAADTSSVLLLDFLARQVRDVPVAVVGSYREVESRRDGIAPLLSRVERQAEQLSLLPLREDDVAAYLQAVAGQQPPATAIETLRDASEGNPLFLAELTRLLLRTGGLQQLQAGQPPPLPRGIRELVRERLQDLSESCLEVVRLASVMGRSFQLPDLAGCFELDPMALEARLEPALEGGVLESESPGRYRFAHIMIREVVHQMIPATERSGLHLCIADELRRLHEEGEPPWSELAHHYAEAGPLAQPQAIEATTEAAKRALGQHAYGDAAVHYRRALEVLDRSSGRLPGLRGELLLGLAGALLRDGAVEPGRQACLDVAGLARELGDSELLARAALEYGSLLVYAAVDATLVGLLRDALAQLDEGDSPLRARVSARYAAALQPAPDPQRPIHLAREAIAMARRIGDPQTLLDTLRAGVSAMMDVLDPAERLPLNREYIALAQRLGDGVGALRGHLRLVFDHAELGDFAAVRAEVEACDAAGAELGHPHYRWPVEAVQAMLAAFEGRFGEAEAHAARARELGTMAGDPNRHALDLQRFVRARLREDPDTLLALLPALEGSTAELGFGQILRIATRCSALARSARIEGLDACASPADIASIIKFGDTSMLVPLAEAAVVARDRNVAAELQQALAGMEHRFVSWGMTAFACEGPVLHVLGLLSCCLGHDQQAEAQLEGALRRARAAGGRPVVARIALDLSEHVQAREPSKARRLRDEAAAIAEALGMPGLLARLRQNQEVAEANAPTTSRGDGVRRASNGVESADVKLVCDGELWRLNWSERELLLKHTKGMGILARLMAEPGREFHALDLSGADKHEPVDRGDAGEVLDEQARRAYQQRVHALREELAEAEAFNDPGRIERARGELEALESELARAVGLGGRDRRTGAAAERARVNVQRRIRDALRRIGQHEPRLEQLLDRRVKTGTFCVYEP